MPTMTLTTESVEDDDYGSQTSTTGETIAQMSTTGETIADDDDGSQMSTTAETTADDDSGSQMVTAGETIDGSQMSTSVQVKPPQMMMVLKCPQQWTLLKMMTMMIIP